MYDRLSACFCHHLIVRAWCTAQSHECWRCTDIRDDDLVRLILHVGDITIDQLRRRLVCSVCRRKSHNIQVVHSSTTTEHRSPRQLPPEAKKKIAADQVARGIAAVTDARQEIRDGKPFRF